MIRVLLGSEAKTFAPVLLHAPAGQINSLHAAEPSEDSQEREKERDTYPEKPGESLRGERGIYVPLFFP